MGPMGLISLIGPIGQLPKDLPTGTLLRPYGHAVPKD